MASAVDRLCDLHEAVSRLAHGVQPARQHDAAFGEMQSLLSQVELFEIVIPAGQLS